MGMQPGALPFPRKELSPREALAVCTPQPLSPLQGRLAPRSEGKARAELRHQSGTTHGSHTPAACSFRARTLEAGQGLRRLAQAGAASCPGLCAIAPGRRSGAPPVCKLTGSFPIQACKHPPVAGLFSPPCRTLGFQAWAQSTAWSCLLRGCFPCAPVVLGSTNAQGKPAKHTHLSLRRRTAPGMAQSGRCFLGTNGATLWLWSCLPKPGAPGP